MKLYEEIKELGLFEKAIDYMKKEIDVDPDFFIGLNASYYTGEFKAETILLVFNPELMAFTHVVIGGEPVKIPAHKVEL